MNSEIGAELCKYIVQKNGMVIQKLPSQYKTKELYELAIGQNPLVIGHISKYKLTYELCKSAVYKNNYAVKYVPKKYLHRLLNDANKIIGFAINIKPSIIKYISSKNITVELCKLAIDKDYKVLKLIKCQSDEICKYAIDKNTDAFTYILNENQTEELCKYAVLKNIYLFKYVSPEYQTEELCKYAVEKNIGMFQHVLPGNQTEELCKFAIGRDLYQITRICKDRLSYSICDFALQEYEKRRQYKEYHIHYFNIWIKDPIFAEFCAKTGIENLSYDTYIEILIQYIDRRRFLLH